MRKVMDKNSYKFSKYGGIIVLDKSMNIIYSYKKPSLSSKNVDTLLFNRELRYDAF